MSITIHRLLASAGGPQSQYSFCDIVDPVKNSLVYYAALREAGAPRKCISMGKVGMRSASGARSRPITEWPELVEDWLKSIGVIAR